MTYNIYDFHVIHLNLLFVMKLRKYKNIAQSHRLILFLVAQTLLVEINTNIFGKGILQIEFCKFIYICALSDKSKFYFILFSKTL